MEIAWQENEQAQQEFIIKKIREEELKQESRVVRQEIHHEVEQRTPAYNKHMKEKRAMRSALGRWSHSEED